MSYSHPWDAKRLIDDPRRKQVIVTFAVDTIDTDMSEQDIVQRAQAVLEEEFYAVTFVESTLLEEE